MSLLDAGSRPAWQEAYLIANNLRMLEEDLTTTVEQINGSRSKRNLENR